MKTLISLGCVLLLFSSCEFYTAEPRYDARDNMVGYYDVEEFSHTYEAYTYYDFRIVKDAYSPREIYLKNFYDTDISVYAYVEYDRITIPFQVVRGYEVEGTGSFRGQTLRLNYRVKDLYDNAYTDFCDTYAYKR